MRKMVLMAKPSVYELWLQAGGDKPAEYDRDRYLSLMREHGYLAEVEKGADFMTDFIPQAGTEPG